MEFAPRHLVRAGFDPKAFLDSIAEKYIKVRVIEEASGEVKEIEMVELLDVISVNLLLSYD